MSDNNEVLHLRGGHHEAGPTLRRGRMEQVVFDPKNLDLGLVFPNDKAAGQSVLRVCRLRRQSLFGSQTIPRSATLHRGVG
jgi:hypothetical protein